MKKIVNEGRAIPAWYGVAYRDWAAFQTICYPVGIHWLMSLWYHVEFKLSKLRLWRVKEREIHEAQIYNKGRQQGYKEGYRIGLDEGREQGRSAAFQDIEAEMGRQFKR